MGYSAAIRRDRRPGPSPILLIQYAEPDWCRTGTWLNESDSYVSLLERDMAMVAHNRQQTFVIGPIAKHAAAMKQPSCSN